MLAVSESVILKDIIPFLVQTLGAKFQATLFSPSIGRNLSLS